MVIEGQSGRKRVHAKKMKRKKESEKKERKCNHIMRYG